MFPDEHRTLNMSREDLDKSFVLTLLLGIRA